MCCDIVVGQYGTPLYSLSLDKKHKTAECFITMVIADDDDAAMCCTYNRDCVLECVTSHPEFSDGNDEYFVAILILVLNWRQL